MKQEFVDIEETYNSDGLRFKMTVNGVPILVPEQYVHLINFEDVEYVIKKSYMTREEFIKRYGEYDKPKK